MILEKIAKSTRARVERDKARYGGAVEREALALRADGGFPFYKALAAPGLSIVCEVKKASPSKGIISEDFPWRDIAKAYERAGADAVSVLTEPEFFLGGARILRDISKTVSLPLLRKDFILDEFQIYEAKVLGASAVLLICALLPADILTGFLSLAKSLGLSVLAEAHDEREAEAALAAGADIVGVNNRNLRDFSVDLGNSLRLRKMIPPGVLFVAESGIRSAADVRVLREAGADAVLVGEALMRRAPDGVEAALKALREA